MLHFKNIKNIEHMLKQKRGEGGGQRRLDLDLGIHHDEWDSKNFQYASEVLMSLFKFSFLDSDPETRGLYVLWRFLLR